MNYTVRPGLNAVWHPHRPVGLRQWRPTDTELRYRSGKLAPRKQPTDTHDVCAGGPLHGHRIRTRHFTGRGKDRYLLAELGDEFGVPPWHGRYRRIDVGRYGWCDEQFGLSAHRRLWAKYAADAEARLRTRSRIETI